MTETNANPPTPTQTRQRPYREIEREALDRLIGAIQVLREVNPNLTLNQALVFLEVAKNDGIENLEVRRRTGLNKMSLSNSIATLTDLGRDKKGGLDLVIQTDNDADGRAKNLNLTEKGKKVTERIVNKIKGLIN